MKALKPYIILARPNFLLLVPVCVFTGASVAAYLGFSIDVLHLVLAFIGALFAHISVNVLNNYSDYKSGIDFKTKKTPFSGGSEVLISSMIGAKKALLFGLGSLAIVVLIGVYFIFAYGWTILPIGIAGVLIIYMYTPYLTKLPFLTEIVGPGLGFGLMVLGTYFTQTGNYSAAAIVVSIIGGLLIANLLLLNEFPDVEPDKTNRRKHLPIILGKKSAAIIYTAISISAYTILVISVATGILPVFALLGLITLPLGLKAIIGALKYHSTVEKLVPYMGVNVIVVLLTPVLLAAGIVINTAIA
ncbi:MAG: prenyltransferase [Chloroflexi bacterium]|nr:prenyltransferase [Chloroflexota bacterium]